MQFLTCLDIQNLKNVAGVLEPHMNVDLETARSSVALRCRRVSGISKCFSVLIFGVRLVRVSDGKCTYSPICA